MFFLAQHFGPRVVSSRYIVKWLIQSSFLAPQLCVFRPDTLDPALCRPGRLDRKVEFGLPDLEGRAHIYKIHAKSMSCERDIRFELLARLCPNSTGAEIRYVRSLR